MLSRGGRRWHGHPGSPRALAVTWTGEQPLAPTTASRAVRMLQLGYSSRLGWPGEKGGVSLGTHGSARLGWGWAHPTAPGARAVSSPGWDHPVARSRTPGTSPIPRGCCSVQCPSSPSTAARTGVGAQGGHFSPQGLVYRPQKEPALNSRFRSALLTSISFRKLELHNYPKPRMNLKRNKTKKQTNERKTKTEQRTTSAPPSPHLPNTSLWQQ